MAVEPPHDLPEDALDPNVIWMGEKQMPKEEPEWTSDPAPRDLRQDHRPVSAGSSESGATPLLPDLARLWMSVAPPHDEVAEVFLVDAEDCVVLLAGRNGDQVQRSLQEEVPGEDMIPRPEIRTTSAPETHAGSRTHEASLSAHHDNERGIVLGRKRMLMRLRAPRRQELFWLGQRSFEAWPPRAAFHGVR